MQLDAPWTSACTYTSPWDFRRNFFTSISFCCASRPDSTRKPSEVMNQRNFSNQLILRWTRTRCRFWSWRSMSFLNLRSASSRTFSEAVMVRSALLTACFLFVYRADTLAKADSLMSTRTSTLPSGPHARLSSGVAVCGASRRKEISLVSRWVSAMSKATGFAFAFSAAMSSFKSSQPMPLATAERTMSKALSTIWTFSSMARAPSSLRTTSTLSCSTRRAWSALMDSTFLAACRCWASAAFSWRWASILLKYSSTAALKLSNASCGTLACWASRTGSNPV
mmetsp:Transcript_24297/g.77559  ORF Transcript_24297/g.77559 Transcript_24297/m.77559 type:complete len:281 (-) Transcript_24297:1015-1857(-)